MRERDGEDRLCLYRLVQDGMLTLAPHLAKRQFRVPLRDMLCIMNVAEERYAFDAFESRPAWQNEPIGTLVLRYESAEFSFSLCVWKGRSTIQRMLTKADTLSLYQFLATDHVEQ